MTKWESLLVIPERELCEAVREKPELQWTPQDVRDTRNMECL
jgi:hypothetical protein